MMLFTLKLTLNAVNWKMEGGVVSPLQDIKWCYYHFKSTHCPAHTTVTLSAGHTRRQMESARLKMKEHMALVGEEILCALDKQQLKFDVRVFVLERLSAAAE